MTTPSSEVRGTLFVAVLLIGCGDWKGAVAHTEPKPEVKPAPVCAESCGDLTEMVEVQTVVKSKECPKGYVRMAIGCAVVLDE